MRFRREIVGALGALVLTACAAAAADPAPTEPAAPSTVGDVGALPAPLPTVALPALTTTSTTIDVLETASLPVEVADPAGASATGNRILLIGDSILASTSHRYTDDMCLALVPLGWQVEVEAEVSRPIAFADTVLDSRLKAGWNAAVIFLGTNYGNDEKDYLRRLNDAITRLGDIPIVLVTVTEHDTEVHEVNDTIRAIVDVYPNLSIVDWQQITTAYPTLLNEDGIHPTQDGRKVLAEAIANRLGPAPAQPGDCLKSYFTDDSAGSVEGTKTGGSSKPSSTTLKPSGGATTTTAKPGSGGTGATTTTVKSTGGSTSVPVTTTGGSTGSTTATTTGSQPATTISVPPTVSTPPSVSVSQPTVPAQPPDVVSTTVP